MLFLKNVMFAATKTVLTNYFSSIQSGRYIQFSQNLFIRNKFCQKFFFLKVLQKLLPVQLPELTKTLKNFCEAKMFLVTSSLSYATISRSAASKQLAQSELSLSRLSPASFFLPLILKFMRSP